MGLKTGLQEIDWATIASLLARESDIEQGKFFNAFCKELGTFGSVHMGEMQLAYTRDLITPENRGLLSMLSYEHEREKAGGK